jgi:hypothetical protein
MSQVLGTLGCWISLCYGPFSVGTHFETYEPFISLISKFFSGHSKTWITETAGTVSADTGRAQLYIHMYICTYVYMYIYEESFGVHLHSKHTSYQLIAVCTQNMYLIKDINSTICF